MIKYFKINGIIYYPYNFVTFFILKKIRSEIKNGCYIFSNDYKVCYKNGEYHSYNDQPAIISSDGIKYWYKEGKQHRDGNLPASTYPNGLKKWYKEGIFIKHMWSE